MTTSRRALVVEDEGLMASLIALALQQANFDVELASSVAEAKRAIGKFDPDVALIDISLGDGPTGVDLAHMLRNERPDIGVLILSKHPDARIAGYAQDLPEGCGFLRKELVGDAAALLEAIELVLRDSALSVRQDLQATGPLGVLSTKQFELLRMLAQGLTNQEIATRLNVSSSSVEQRLGLIFAKLGIADLHGVNPRAEAIRLFIAHAGLPNRD